MGALTNFVFKQHGYLKIIATLRPVTGKLYLITAFLILLIAEAPFYIATATAEELSFAQRNRAVQQMLAVIRGYGMTDPEILNAVKNVPRHKFVPEKHRKYAYQDTPLPIGYGQTISQPYIVAEMTRQLKLSPGSKVLEIGTGSGYQAAVLAEITNRVYSIEIVRPLLDKAKHNLTQNGYSTVRLKHGDGYYGWSEFAPYDGIIVTCAAGHIPPPLLKQLAVGGRMIIPVGKRFGTQYLILVIKNSDGSITSKSLMAVRFVPLVRK